MQEIKEKRNPADSGSDFDAPVAGQLTDNLRRLKAERMELEAQKKAIDARIKSQSKASTLFGQKMLQANKQLDMQYSFYQKLQKHYFDAEIQKIYLKNRIRTHDRASFEKVVEKLPLTKKIIYSLMVSILLISVFIFGWELINPKVHTRADIDTLGFYYLGSVPEIGQRKYNLFVRRDSKRPLCDFNVASPATVAFRYLRTRLLNQVSRSGEGARVVTVMSAMSGDGKSVVAANLAISLSKLGKKVLLMDCDFRKASLDEIFSVNSVKGVSNIVNDGEHVDVAMIRDLEPNLDYMPTGRTFILSDDLQAQASFAEVMDKFKKEYDIIVMDTPAFKAGPEAIILARYANFPVIVASANTTKVRDLWEIDEALQGWTDYDKVYAIINKLEFSLETRSIPYSYRKMPVNDGQEPTSTRGAS
ncbi:MAG: CpsD/CapB family tyrosine-protein kinase [Bdellovibrionales bacterium]